MNKLNDNNFFLFTKDYGDLIKQIKKSKIYLFIRKLVIVLFWVFKGTSSGIPRLVVIINVAVAELKSCVTVNVTQCNLKSKNK